MLALSWRYRWGCIKIIVLQLVLLGTTLLTIALTGLGIDVLRHALDPKVRAPAWPRAFTPPA
ncbi:MAG: hypothetical protein EBS01_09790, partial [Verrucomicrobia bacterium]|nr:hypothetical protein [Verrucomicrobiota bacterium]